MNNHQGNLTRQDVTATYRIEYLNQWKSELRAWTGHDLKPTHDTFRIQRLHGHFKIMKMLEGYC
jgi:hypothetical protein